MKRAVVLGGSGFVGRHICRALDCAGWSVHTVTRRPAGVRSVVLDLCREPSDVLRSLLGEMSPVAVVNAAGAVWGATAKEMAESNVLLVRRLVAALPAGTRLVHIGSVHEYGVTGDTPIRESTPSRPVTDYGRGKAEATEHVLAATRAGAADGVVLRVSNAIGAGAPYGSLPGRVAGDLAAIARGERPAVLEFPVLNATRDFVDVRDVATAVVDAAAAPAVSNVLNIGSGRATHVRQLVMGLIAASGVPATISETSGGSPGNSIEIEIEAARACLGWRPRYTLDESLSTMWRSVAPPAGDG